MLSWTYYGLYWVRYFMIVCFISNIVLGKKKLIGQYTVYTLKISIYLISLDN